MKKLLKMIVGIKNLIEVLDSTAKEIPAEGQEDNRREEN